MTSSVALIGYGRFGRALAERWIETGLSVRAVDPSAPRAKGRAVSRYRLERAALVMARRNIHHNLLGRGVRKVREVCDLLLR